MPKRSGKLIKRLRQNMGRAQRFLHRTLGSRGSKVVVAILGGSVVLVGIAMIVLPGPAFLVIPLGLAILATEFVWARHWLKRTRALIPKVKKKPAQIARKLAPQHK